MCKDSVGYGLDRTGYVDMPAMFGRVKTLPYCFLSLVFME